MTTHYVSDARIAEPDALLTAPDPVQSAREHIETLALAPDDGGRVGLELEFHLVDLADPAHRPGWKRILELADGLPAMPSGSSVTVEPGGQLELSTPPTLGVAPSIAALQADRVVLREGLAAAGFGTAPLGTDPARPVQRVNPSERYAAMEQHFTAVDCAAPGTAMMTATAALQVNLDAGPRSGWARRMAHLHALGPTLVALSACSPLLAGRSSGWRSMRQEVWHGIDNRRSSVIAGADPAGAWAAYALEAPVMLVRGTPTRAVTDRVSLHDWLRGGSSIERRPTLADVDYHLTTLFPPVRPRGYLELRCLDALPDRWWPALAALTVALIDDPVAADEAAALCEPVRDAWVEAARDGLDDPSIRAAAVGCAEVAARRCAPELRAEVEAYAELVARGRTPGDELLERARATDPLTVLEEEAHA